MDDTTRHALQSVRKFDLAKDGYRPYDEWRELPPGERLYPVVFFFR